MSITGHSLLLQIRQRISDRLPERASSSEFVSSHIDQSGDDPPGRVSILSQVSISKRQILNSPRHPLSLLSDELRIASRSSFARRQQAKSQDSRSPPSSGANVKLSAKKNETARVNGIAKDDSAHDAIRKPGIVVVHSRTFFRDCFVRCLEISYKSHEIVAFGNIGAWRGSIEEAAINPSIVVFFVDSTDTSSTNDLQFLETMAAETPVVIVSDIDDVNYVVRALKGGARGYIPTSLSFNVAVEAVRLVEAGGTFVPVSSLAMDRNRQQAAAKTGDLLTERQMMVVEALCQGMANKQIAYELGMSEHTVKVHLRHIMRKLRARNRTEVAVLTKDFFERSSDQKRSEAEDGSH